MTATVAKAPERLPEIGTVINPSVFFDGRDLLLCYEIAPLGGDGNAVIKFTGVIDFRINPINVEGLSDCKYPIAPWEFNEVSGAREVEVWEVLEPRFWMVSFTDVTLEIVFESVSLVFRTREKASPRKTLAKYLQQ